MFASLNDRISRRVQETQESDDVLVQTKKLLGIVVFPNSAPACAPRTLVRKRAYDRLVRFVKEHPHVVLHEENSGDNVWTFVERVENDAG